MHEDLLHYIWKTQKFKTLGCRTTAGLAVQVLHPGSYNLQSGPDFFNARLRIDGQQWAGNVEIHLKSSDWYAHHHEKDEKYHNVILHVVWEDDSAIFHKDGTPLNTLELKHHVDHELLTAYQTLMRPTNQNFINCEQDLGSMDEALWQTWMQRLYVSRLEQRAIVIQDLLMQSKNDWERVLFMLLMKGFGLNKNGAAFLKIAKHLPAAVVRKTTQDPLQLESLLFGTAGLLNNDAIIDDYYVQLTKTYKYLRHKHELLEYKNVGPEFYGLRPSNFPTIRLSQLANLYALHPNLFAALVRTTSLEEFYQL
ncbi:MAG: DUF2851 family protein, partial [Bacteroidota bacterium]